MKKEERVDLFVIDPQNKFIMLIENKSRAEHSEKQLQGYRESFADAAKKSPHLRDYDQVYIALDRDFDGEDSSQRPCSDTWLHLGYDWLKTSATRALLHVERGNASARLVVSYCNRQTDWESPEERRCIGLASALHQRHPEATRELVESSTGRLEKNWLETKQPSSSLLFMLQNKSVLSMLRETKGMASVKTELLERVPAVTLDNIDLARARLYICPTGWEQFASDAWPLFMSVRFADQTQAKFNLKLVWSPESVNEAFDADDLRHCLEAVEPKFRAFGESRFRRVLMGSALSLADLAKKVSELNGMLQAVAPAQ